MRASVPLTQTLPWSIAGEGRTFVVCDSVESDGRFLLHTLTTQVLAKKSGRILWVACGAWTDRLIAAALKKMGCDAATSYLRSNSASDAPNQPLNIVPVGIEVATRLEENEEFDCEMYLKELYHRIQSWATSSSSENADILGPTWIVLDDASTMATLFGERITYFFIMTLRGLVQKLPNQMGLIMRCSHDIDQQDAKEAEEGNSSTVHPSSSSRSVDWIGINVTEKSLCRGDRVPLERQLVELADGIIDVLPLATGYSREAHGRLVFTAPPGGRGWGSTPTQSSQRLVTSLSSSVINYCLTDSSVLAIR